MDLSFTFGNTCTTRKRLDAGWGDSEKRKYYREKPRRSLWRREEAGQSRYGSDLPRLLNISLYIMSFINTPRLYIFLCNSTIDRCHRINSIYKPNNFT